MEKQDLSIHLSDAFKQPVQVQQYASSIPSEAKVLVRESEHQFTRDDAARTIDRKMRTSIHYLNPPLTDGLNSVGAIYKALADAAFNYQQEHVTSYYEMFPRLTQAVLTTSEWTAADSTWLRLNYRRISTRVAHRIWHYCQTSTMLAAALINMINLGRYEGSEVNFKTIASAFRASRINTATPNYNKFPKVKGVEDYLVANGLYLAGQANDGTPIISIPLYATDIFGNRGWHHLPMSTFVSLDGKDKIYQEIMDDAQEPGSDFMALQFNVSRTILEYAKANQEFDFRMPQIENMGMLYVQNKDNIAASARSGGGGNQRKEFGNWDDGSLFIKSIFNNYANWAKYITKYFSDFADVTSDWYRLITDTLGIATESKTTASLVSVVRSMKYATVEDYLRQSRFGASNKATCATIVKYMPYVQGDDTQNTDDFILENFERYDFWEDNMRQVIRKSLRYPKLTPTVFESNLGDEGINTYYCGNTGPNYLPADQLGNMSTPSDDSGLEEKFEGTSPLVYGQRALYDLTRAVSVDVELDQVVTIGLTKEASLDIANRDTTSKVYDELRSALFVDVLPLIDDTDPYVCGLSYFFAHDSALKSQTELTLIDSGNARLVDDLERVTVDAASNVPKFNDPTWNFGNHDIYPLSEAYDDDINADATTPVKPAHISNDGYYASRKHVVVFGGVGVCEDVINAALLQNSGSEFKRLSTDTLVGEIYRELAEELRATGENSNNYPVFLGQLLSDLTPRLVGDNEVNSVAAVLAILKTFDAPDPAEMITEITLPFTYGAVAINANPSPLRGAKTVLNLIPSDWKAGSQGTVPAIQIFQTGYCRKPSEAVYSKDLDYMSRVDGYDIALEKSVYGLSHFEKTILDTDGYIDVNRGFFQSPVFSPLLDGKLRLMGTTFVKALGERNTVAFWDHDHSAVHDLSHVGLNQSIDFKRNDYVAEVATRQRVHDTRGMNGTSSKQGDAPKFIASNEKRSAKPGSAKTSKRKFRGRRKTDDGVMPEKPTYNRRGDSSSNGADSKSEVQKPFLDSMSGMASTDDKKAVVKAKADSSLKASDVAAM